MAAVSPKSGISLRELLLSLRKTLLSQIIAAKIDGYSKGAARWWAAPLVDSPTLASMLNERHTNALRDGLIEKMRRAGIDVNSDWQEGERVLNNVNLKANSERNGAFSGDSSTNSKSFEGKVHLHRSSLSDSKDVAKVRRKLVL